MEKLHWTLKKIISLILGLLGIGTLTSCYGVVPVMMYGTPSNYDGSLFSLSGKVKGDINKDGEIKEPVKYIEISIKAKNNPSDDETNQNDEYFDLYETTKTDENGNFSIYWEYKDSIKDYKITFKDIDGQENGSFKDKSIDVQFTDEDILNYHEYDKSIDDIELETKSDNDN